MTTKTTAARPAEAREPRPDDLQTAYQVHTLAQMLYGRLAVAPQWAPLVQTPFPPVIH